MNNLEITSAAPTTTFPYDQLNRVDELACSHGLYAKFINYKNGFSPVGAGQYIVVGMNPLSDNINPYKMSAKIERDPNLFYPGEFAVQVTGDNFIVALERITDYCKDAEFLAELYNEYGAKLPECIRYTELTGLKNWAIGRFNEDMPASFRMDCAKGLKTFFKNEKALMGQEKRRFFRSSRYDEKASSFQKKADFTNRDSSIVRLPVLLQSSAEIGKKRIGSSELEAFCNYIKSVYPDILIAISEKEVVDLGLLDLAKKNPNLPSFSKQRPVTNEAFRKVINERFAAEGFDCTNDIQPAYWEYYDIYYKKVDEPQIITAYNDVFFRFADHDSLQSIKARGPISMVTLPAENFHYFVAFAKEAGLRFNIDHRGVFSAPSFTDIHVIYSHKDTEIMNDVIDKMISSDIITSHISLREDFSGLLDGKIKNARGLLSESSFKAGARNDGYEKG